MRRRPELRPAVGISACLLGEPVRYDGTDRRREVLARDLAQRVRWIPVCPEVELGLGVPRETIRLEQDGAAVRLRGTSSRADLTQGMATYAKARLEALRALPLCGYVLKARSPSCGLAAEVVGAGGRPVAVAPGRFAEAIQRAFPGLPVAEDEDLSDPARRESFVQAVLAFRGR
jgi:uncharacterized protein YbbK (DUF523 family)